jgi:hypothetical protein
MVSTLLQPFRLHSEASNSSINGPFMGKTFTNIKTYYVKFARHNLKFSHCRHTHKAIHTEFLGRLMFNLRTKVHTSSWIHLLIIVASLNANCIFFTELVLFYILQKNPMKS